MSFVTETSLLYAILGSIWLKFLWECYLVLRQFQVCKNTVSAPAELENVIPQETFDQSRSYLLDRLKFDFLKEAFTTILVTKSLCDRELGASWMYAAALSPDGSEIVITCIWLLLVSVASIIADLPFALYYTFALEGKYGFNKQTLAFFVMDKVVEFMVDSVITSIAASALIFIIRSGGKWLFFWLWLTETAFAFALLTLHPRYIAPLFDKFQPLPQGELRTKIETLASNLNFPLEQLYVIVGSKRSSHTNAYFYGVFGAKRIVLYDTILDYPHEEILAILSHELGHWHHHHILKNIILIQASLLVSFGAFSYFYQSPILYRTIGLPKDSQQPVLLGILVIATYVLMPYNVVCTYVRTWMHRRFEFEADEFAVKLGRGRNLEKAVVRMYKENLEFPIFDPVFSSWYLTHPTLLERLDAIKEASRNKTD